MQFSVPKLQINIVIAKAGQNYFMQESKKVYDKTKSDMEISFRKIHIAYIIIL